MNEENKCVKPAKKSYEITSKDILDLLKSKGCNVNGYKVTYIDRSHEPIYRELDFNISVTVISEEFVESKEADNKKLMEEEATAKQAVYYAQRNNVGVDWPDPYVSGVAGGRL